MFQTSAVKHFNEHAKYMFDPVMLNLVLFNKQVEAESLVFAQGNVMTDQMRRENIDKLFAKHFFAGINRTKPETNPRFIEARLANVDVRGTVYVQDYWGPKLRGGMHCYLVLREVDYCKHTGNFPRYMFHEGIRRSLHQASLTPRHSRKFYELVAVASRLPPLPLQALMYTMGKEATLEEWMDSDTHIGKYFYVGYCEENLGYQPQTVKDVTEPYFEVPIHRTPVKLCRLIVSG